jgi:large subunit ribosomal protein L29
MKTSQVRDKNDEELRKELSELHREAFNLRMQQATGQLARSSQIRVVRRDIARIKTILNERTRPAQA